MEGYSLSLCVVCKEQVNVGHVNIKASTSAGMVQKSVHYRCIKGRRCTLCGAKAGVNGVGRLYADVMLVKGNIVCGVQFPYPECWLCGGDICCTGEYVRLSTAFKNQWLPDYLRERHVHTSDIGRCPEGHSAIVRRVPSEVRTEVRAFLLVCCRLANKDTRMRVVFAADIRRKIVQYIIGAAYYEQCRELRVCLIDRCFSGVKWRCNNGHNRIVIGDRVKCPGKCQYNKRISAMDSVRSIMEKIDGILGASSEGYFMGQHLEGAYDEDHDALFEEIGRCVAFSVKYFGGSGDSCVGPVDELRRLLDM